MYEVQQHQAPPISAQGVHRPGSPVDPLRLLAQFKRWRFVFLLSGVVGIAAGFAAALNTTPHTYESVTTLEWSGSTTGSEFEALVAAIKIRPNLARIREKLLLGGTPLDQIARRLRIQVFRGKRAFSITAIGPNAEGVKKLADTAVSVLFEHRKRTEHAASLEHKRALQDQVATARASLAKARAEYDAFRRKHGVVDVELERAVIAKAVGALQGAAQEAGADAASERVRARVLRSFAGKLPKRVLVRETEIRPEVNKLKSLESELAALKAGLSPTHPKALSLEAEVGALRKLVADTKGITKQQTFGRNPQIDSLLQGATVATARRRASRTRQAVLTASMARARQRLARLSALEGRATELLTMVRTATSHLAARQAALRDLEDRLRDPTSKLRVLAAADRPSYPSKSYRKVIAAGIPVVAVILTFLVWLAWAFWGLRVHSAKELAYWASGPVVATSTWPKEAEALTSLAAELDIPLSRVAVGAYLRELSIFAPMRPLLLVPASPWEAPFAESLGARLSGADAPDGELPDRSAIAFEVWRGPLRGAELRLAVQQSDRVLVLLASNRHSFLAASGLHARLGRTERVAFLLCNMNPSLADLDSQVGAVTEFWEDPLEVPTGPRGPRLLPAPNRPEPDVTTRDRMT